MINRWRKLLNPGDQGSSLQGEPGAKGADINPAQPAPEDRKGIEERAKREAIEERKKRQAAEAEVKKFKDEAATRDAALKKMLGQGDTETPEQAMARVNSEKTATENKARTALLKSAVMREAMIQGAADPEDVFALGKWADVNVDLETAAVSEVKDQVADLLKKKPHLVGRRPGSTPPGGSPPGSDPKPDADIKNELKTLAQRAQAGDAVAQMEIAKRLPEIKKLKLDLSNLG